MRKETIAEIFEATMLIALMAGMFVLYLVATPDQFSAECDRQRAEIEASKTTSR